PSAERAVRAAGGSTPRARPGARLPRHPPQGRPGGSRWRAQWRSGSERSLRSRNRCALGVDSWQMGQWVLHWTVAQMLLVGLVAGRGGCASERRRGGSFWSGGRPPCFLGRWMLLVLGGRGRLLRSLRQRRTALVVFQAQDGALYRAA